MKKFIALLCVSIMIISISVIPTEAAEQTSYGDTTSSLAQQGFIVDKAVYGKMCTAVKSSVIINDLTSGYRQRKFTQTSRVYICRENGTRKDIILTYAELIPGNYKYSGKSSWGYAESLTVSCKFVNNSAGAEYESSSPKSQTVNKKYTVGGSASVSSNNEGVITGALGVSGSVNVTEPVLTIRNQSLQDTNNSFKVMYDFKAGKNAKDPFFTNYLFTTTEHIGVVSVNANGKNYGFCMKFATNVAYTCGNTVYNSSYYCTKIQDERALITNFK